MQALSEIRRSFSESPSYAFANALYRTILKRSPGPGDLEGCVASIESAGLSDSFEPVMETFLDSEEAAGQAGYRLRFWSEDREATPVVAMVSLGTTCYTSYLLKAAGLKRFSTPFDWIFSNTGMVWHCIRDDFETFLNPEFFAPVPEAERPSLNEHLCDHLFYREQFGVERVFNHHTPSEPQDYDYFRRCVERFRSLKDAPGRKLFILCTAAASELAEDFSLIGRALQEYVSDPELLFVSIEPPQPDLLLPQLEVAETSDVGRLIRLRPTSRLPSLKFVNPVDDLAVLSLVRGYRFA